MTLYRVFRANVTGWRLVEARDEAAAMRRFRNATAAREVRPSSYWQEQRELGLYPKPSTRTRRK